ncbi:cytochrome c oxidase subunit 7B2, mitochondrial [Sorex araneus]|uniref:cytochrome c oxidase subunit 7B2, mitochondrial n=1 Tax=Sorex araneus TaxID=42254 RepID=UPI000331847C|nr:cytochrome c oxidase subunit 7B2, mitochondrial [Sorex araneus]
MNLLARSAISYLKIQSIQQFRARHSHTKCTQGFHDRYGNVLLVSGSAFCLVTWWFVLTQSGVNLNLSPVGRVTPKEWND